MNKAPSSTLEGRGGGRLVIICTLVGALLMGALLLSPASTMAAGELDQRGAWSRDGRPATRPSAVGVWQAPQRWPVVGVHAFVLPTGEVLHFSYAGAEGPPEERRYQEGTKAVVWNPKGGSFFDISFDGSVFCSGHSFLGDGRLFVTGGLKQEICLTQGLAETWFLDPFTLEWAEGPEMAKPRYYPTNLALGDGGAMILSGNGANCTLNGRMEIFYPDLGAEGRLKGVGPGARAMRLYPRVHLLPDGRVAHVGPEESTWIWTPKSRSWKRLENTRLSTQRLEGASFAIPGKAFEIMTCGGFTERDANPTETCERIDFSESSPTWRPAASMRFARAHANVVVLPDGKVMMVGGGAEGFYVDPELRPELYDPETESWTLLPPQRFSRMYHSTAILLPDGRVLSAGEDENPDSPSDSGAWAEAFKPGYLAGAAPKIRTAPDSAPLGGSFTVGAKGAKKVRSAVLMGLAAMTHSVNMGQRYVDVEVDRLNRKELEIRIPDNPNLVPPGFYMLFILNKKGKPSPAHMIQITAEPSAS